MAIWISRSVPEQPNITLVWWRIFETEAGRHFVGYCVENNCGRVSSPILLTPMLKTDADVASFLGVEPDIVGKLVGLGILRRPLEEELGHDIDRVLDAQRFLEKELLTISQLRQLVGVPIDWEDLSRNDLLPRWNPKALSDNRVLLSHVIQMHQRIRATIDAASEPTNGMLLRDAASQSHRPFMLLLTGIARLLNGGFKAASWEAPYDWSSIRVEKSEADVLADELDSSESQVVLANL